MNKPLVFCFNAPAKQTVGQEGAPRTGKRRGQGENKRTTRVNYYKIITLTY